MRDQRNRLTGARRRSFEEALRSEADLNTAQGVIVVAADGSLTLLASSGLDRQQLAEQLVALAFEQPVRGVFAAVPTQRPPHPSGAAPATPDSGHDLR